MATSEEMHGIGSSFMCGTEEGEPWTSGLFRVVVNADEDLSIRKPLTQKSFDYCVQTPSPFEAGLGEISLGQKRPAEVSEIYGNLPIRGGSLREWPKGLSPLAYEGEGLFFSEPCGYVTAQISLTEGCEGPAQPRSREEYDILRAKLSQIEVAHSNLVCRFNDTVQDRDMLQAALSARDDAQLRMTDTYEGIVRHVGANDVVVLFAVDDDLVEHTYRRDQFIDSRLPEKGDRLAVYVHVAHLPPEESGEGADEAMEGSDEQPRRRRNIGAGPREF